MPTHLFPSANVISGEPVAIADLGHYGVVAPVKQIKSVREYSPAGTHAAPELEHTIVQAIAAETKYFVCFESLSGNPTLRWEFADQADADAEIVLIEAVLSA